nr:uncharacterized mitochondrial protein AtMg00810-like [Tanacetum cinerariifolium]
MMEKSKLDEDREGKAVDPSHYRGMIDTLLYLTASRPDLQSAICMCARYQARPTEKHDSSVALTAFADADHASCQDTRRSTAGSVTMETTIEQQVAMDESKESTLQLVYDVLPRCPFFKVFMVIADVPEIYMQEFWATDNVYHHAIRFKMDNKKHIVNLESFRNMLHICPRIHGQSFAKLPFEEEILDFIRFLGHSATIRTLTDVNINKLYQPWRSFAAIINKCLTGKSSGYDSLRLSKAQILWGLYHKRNVDYSFLIWEDFVYQVEHKNHKKSNEMYYPRFTKVIIHHFMSKDPSIPRRNKMNYHYVRDDFMFLTIKLVSRQQNTQQFTPNPKASARRTRIGSDTSITPPTTAATPRPTAAASPRLTAAAKGKQTAKAPKAKSLSALFEVAMTEAQQLKQSRQQTHISQPGGFGTDEGTGADDQGKVEDDDEGDEGDKDDAEESGHADEEGGSDGEDDDEETKDDEL